MHALLWYIILQALLIPMLACIHVRMHPLHFYCNITACHMTVAVSAKAKAFPGISCWISMNIAMLGTLKRSRSGVLLDADEDPGSSASHPSTKKTPGRKASLSRIFEDFDGVGQASSSKQSREGNTEDVQKRNAEQHAKDKAFEDFKVGYWNCKKQDVSQDAKDKAFKHLEMGRNFHRHFYERYSPRSNALRRMTTRISSTSRALQNRNENGWGHARCLHVSVPGDIGKGQMSKHSIAWQTLPQYCKTPSMHALL